MILYSGPMSLFTGKVRIALDEKGLDYELVAVPFSPTGSQPKHPKVLELNPKAQVPVLVDGALAIYDAFQREIERLLAANQSLASRSRFRWVPGTPRNR